MSSYYLEPDSKEWKKVDSNVNLEEFALKMLLKFEGLDSNKYHKFIEFDCDNVRTYMSGVFDDYRLRYYCYGNKNKIDYFLEYMYDNQFKIEQYPDSPKKIYLLIINIVNKFKNSFKIRE